MAHSIQWFGGFEEQVVDHWQASSGGALESSIVSDGQYAYRFDVSGATGYVQTGVDLTAAGNWTNSDRHVWISYQNYIVTLPTAGNHYTLSLLGPGKSRLRVDENGALTLTSQESGSANWESTGITLSTGQWYTISHKAISSQACEVVVYERTGSNKTALGSYTHTNSLGSTVQVESVRLGPSETSTGDVIFDNYVLESSTSTSAIDDPVQLLTARYAALLGVPTGTGNDNHGNWSGSWEDLDEVPPDNDTTTRANSSSGTSRFTSLMTNTGVLPAALKSVSAVSAMMKSKGATDYVLACRSGTTNSDTSNVTESSSYIWPMKVFDNDPDTSSEWELAGVDGFEVGAMRTAGSIGITVTATYYGVLGEVSVAGGNQGPIWFMFENARSTWDTIFGGLQAPKDRDKIWRPEPQVLTV